jgi:hypothetical protein
MPVVHIVGSIPEGICDLPQQLRDRGFDVETIPDTANCQPGTLEITLQECSTEEALSRALALAQDNDIAILVSPGVISPAPVFDSAEEQIPSAIADAAVSAREATAPAPVEAIEPPTHPQETEPVYLACDTHFEPPLEVATEPVAPAEAALPLKAEDDSDWPIWQVAAEDEQAPLSALETPQPESPIWTEHVAALHSLGKRFLAAAQLNRILSDDALFTRMAACSAAVAILVLMLGLTVHRFSPLPARILHGSREAAQPAPFQRPAVVGNPITASEVVSAGAAEPPGPSVTRASAYSGARRSSGSRHTIASGDADFIAKDTVVRFNRPRSETLPQTARKQSGVKYYTDLKQ